MQLHRCLGWLDFLTDKHRYVFGFLLLSCKEMNDIVHRIFLYFQSLTDSFGNFFLQFLLELKFTLVDVWNSVFQIRIYIYALWPNEITKVINLCQFRKKFDDLHNWENEINK